MKGKRSERLLSRAGCISSLRVEAFVSCGLQDLKWEAKPRVLTEEVIKAREKSGGSVLPTPMAGLDDHLS